MKIETLDADGVEQHVDELAQLLLDAHASNMALGLLAPLTRERARDEWLRLGAALDPHARVLLAASVDGVVVGAVHLARSHAENGTHRGEVQRLVVRGDRRGRGIGTALLAALTDRARELGITLLQLTTHADTPSEAFYAHNGWTHRGTIPGYALLPDGSLAANAFFYREL